MDLRYGENAYQARAILYQNPSAVNDPLALDKFIFLEESSKILENI
jgi:hypothetical protein